jgi:hypothetical protein
MERMLKQHEKNIQEGVRKARINKSKELWNRWLRLHRWLMLLGKWNMFSFILLRNQHKICSCCCISISEFSRDLWPPWMDRPWELYFLPRGFWITLQLINLWSSPPGRRIGVWSLSEANPGFVTARKFTLKNQPNSKTIFKTYCKIYLLISTPLSSNLHLLPNHNQFTPHFFSTTHQLPLSSLLSLAPCRAS